MTIREALNLGYKKTKSPARQSFSDGGTLDSEVLLSHVLDKPKQYLFSNPGKKLKPKQEKQFSILLARRQLGEPVAYLRLEKEFFSLKFLVTKDTLIPRPETETLVELVLSRIKNQKSLSILDIGTGSGSVIISLAKTLGNRNTYFGSDVSKKALVVAQKNARRHKVKIIFKHGSLLTPWKNQKFDIIVANLPYGWRAWKNNSSTATIGLRFEPQIALYTKNKGVYHIEKLLKQTSTLKPLPSNLFLEFDPRQVRQIRNLVRKYLSGFDLNIHKDLTGRDRIAEIKKAQ